MVKKLLEVFMKKNCKKLVNKNLEQKKYLKKGNKLYVKWKEYDNRFNSWIDKKDPERNVVNEILSMKVLNPIF